MTVHGSCLCESVKYEIEGDPFRFNVCYCSNCAKVTGAAAGNTLTFKEEQVTYSENPAGVISTYEDTKLESGNTLFRQFCSKCGSTLFITAKNYVGIIIVPYGGVDDAPDRWKPTHEVWCRSKKEWLQQPIPEQSY